MLSTPVISQCATCSSAEPAQQLLGGPLAECILCGKQFLLPLASALPTGKASTTPVVVKPSTETPTPNCVRNKRLLISIFLSVALNAGALCLLGLIYFHVSSEPDNEPLIAEFSENTDDDFVLFPEFDSGGGAVEQALLQTNVQVIDILVSDVGTTPVGNADLPSGVGQRGSGKGRGGRGSGIFGGVGSAKSFAYVVDASGSMSGGRMPLVLNELRHSIQSLKEDQEFFVVFYNDHTFPMMWPKIEKRLVRANDINKDRVIKWAFSVEPIDGTLPEQALRMALHLKPDIVFFLTDGDIPEGSLRIVKKYRKKSTSVHTICVGESVAPVMQEIAVVGNGEFLLVRDRH